MPRHCPSDPRPEVNEAFQEDGAQMGLTRAPGEIEIHSRTEIRSQLRGTSAPGRRERIEKPLRISPADVPTPRINLGALNGCVDHSLAFGAWVHAIFVVEPPRLSENQAHRHRLFAQFAILRGTPLELRKQWLSFLSNNDTDRRRDFAFGPGDIDLPGLDGFLGAPQFLPDSIRIGAGTLRELSGLGRRFCKRMVRSCVLQATVSHPILARIVLSACRNRCGSRGIVGSIND